ncbi:hypothetical protein [Streptomyces sp. NPDC055632]
MTSQDDRRFPVALAAAMTVRLDRFGRDGVNFELCESLTSSWRCAAELSSTAVGIRRGHLRKSGGGPF